MKKATIILCVPATLLTLLTGSYVMADSGKGHKEDSFRARLTGFQEVPTNSTTGRGEFRAKLNSGETELTYELAYSELQGGTAVAAHVHLGATGTNGGVIFFLCGGGGKPACPATSGTVTGTVTAADILGLAGQGIAPGEFDEVLRAMRSRATYVNVHTVPTWPGGEIRGQVRHENKD